VTGRAAASRGHGLVVHTVFPSVPPLRPVFADGAARVLAERVGAEDGAAAVVQAVEATAAR
jgi:hypothetical protein